MSDRAQSPSGSDAGSDSQGSSSWVVKTFSRVPSPGAVGSRAGAGAELHQSQPGPAVHYYGGLDGEAESFVSDEDEDSMVKGRGGPKTKGDKSRSDDEGAAKSDN
ncbi:unnamed protein product [Parascedosporium putredinis]|uniref:Uncharacterized protein n=1 Tax=Parascedosporium putredinis TaxID=1442378 RepID=A0A9P1H6S0_9PEZI|nr:unnamed protein product [Parascedosporium putredinis]CAI7999069.1 unnamed protein product [Parascedosporium putredinis]